MENRLIIRRSYKVSSVIMFISSCWISTKYNLVIGRFLSILVFDDINEVDLMFLKNVINKMTERFIDIQQLFTP